MCLVDIRHVTHACDMTDSNVTCRIHMRDVSFYSGSLARERALELMALVLSLGARGDRAKLPRAHWIGPAFRGYGDGH